MEGLFKFCGASCYSVKSHSVGEIEILREAVDGLHNMLHAGLFKLNRSDAFLEFQNFPAHSGSCIGLMSSVYFGADSESSAVIEGGIGL